MATKAGQEANVQQQPPHPTEQKGIFGFIAFFLNGPYFDVIDVTPGAAQSERSREISSKLASAVASQRSTEGYGVAPADLMTLPFDPPKFVEYVVDIFSGVVKVALKLLILFIMVTVEEDQRGGDLQWKRFITALLVLYSTVTLGIIILMTCEMNIRRFMYYRLLSLQVLVDWENIPLWHGWFFWYIMSTWVMINVWTVYGIVKYWGKNLSDGPDPVSATALVTVNIQMFEVFSYYLTLQSAETRLITLNKFVERAPHEAQKLIGHTYMMKDIILQAECYVFAERTRIAWKKRLINILSCGGYGVDWKEHMQKAEFRLNELKESSDNYAEVRGAEAKLHGNPVVAAEDIELSLAKHPGMVSGATSFHSVTDAPEEGGVRNKESEQDRANQKAKKLMAQVKPYEDNIWGKIEYLIEFIPKQFFRGLYATRQAVLISVLPAAKSWPFRRDVSNFRFILACEAICFMAIGGLVVYAVLMAVSSTCSNVYKQCRVCDQQITGYSGQCPVNDITRLDIIQSTFRTVLGALRNATLPTLLETIEPFQNITNGKQDCTADCTF